MNDRIIIAVDFDGTLVKHRFPHIGQQVPGAFEYCRQFIQEGASLILWTMRCCKGTVGDVLTPAVEFCRSNGVEFWGVNENPQQTESRWSTSGKVYAHAYVDDAAAGTPLLRDTFPGAHEHCRDQAHLPYVDWPLVGPHVLGMIRMLKQLRETKIDTTNLDHDNNYFSERFGLAPQVELPKATLINP